jgi:exodeoxyribonuclease VII small subunit
MSEEDKKQDLSNAVSSEKSDQIAKEIAAMSFEEALEELKRVTEIIDSDQASLTQSMEYFERGVRLKQHCQNILDDVKMRVKKISDEGGDEDVPANEDSPKS